MLLLAVAVAGCGAMLNGPSQRVKIWTVPPGARVTVDGRDVGSAGSVPLARDRDHTVVVDMAGFEPVQTQLLSVPDNTGMIANCLLLLCIPQIWEQDTASQYRLEPRQIDVYLDPVGWSPR